MKTLKSRFKREPFEETYNYSEPSKVRKVIPIETEHGVVLSQTEVDFVEPKFVPYDAFTAAKVYELGEISPINLADNMSTAEHLQQVSSFENMYDSANSDN